MGYLRLSSLIATFLVIGLMAGLPVEQTAMAQAGNATGVGSAWSRVTAAARGARPAAPPSAAPGNAVPAAGNAGFAPRVSSTVGRPASQAGALPPGVGNINRPGVAPAVLPGFRPPPTNIQQGIPNINHPGGIPTHLPANGSGFRPGRGSRFEGRRGVKSGRVGGTVVYGVPYYEPYYVYPEAGYAEDSGAAVAPESEPYSSQYIPPPVEPGVTSFPEGGQGTMEGSVEGPGQGSVEDTQPGGAPLQTLLVLKDHTLLLVTNYWLNGDSLSYDTGNGEEFSILISQLDFSLSQQLNRERNVPFILQSRP